MEKQIQIKPMDAQELEIEREYKLVNESGSINTIYLGQIDGGRYHSFFTVHKNIWKSIPGKYALIEVLATNEELILEGNNVKCRKDFPQGFGYRIICSPNHPFFEDEKKKNIMDKMLEGGLVA